MFFPSNLLLGKTSTKLLLVQALNCYSKSIGTPKSYNTPLGISKFINDNILSVYDNIVIEYGISKINDMDKLKSIVKPNVVFITEIGLMHIDGLKNIDNIIKEKMKLVSDAKIIVLNYENEYIRNYQINKEIISYGFNYGRYRAVNLSNGSFDFFDGDKFIEHIETTLVGKHQILNFLGVISYCYYCGLDINILKRACLGFKVEKNRLEVKKINNMKILDDSFNSNYKGFIEALNILKNENGYKILLTPGLVELGKYNKKLMDNLVDYIVSSCDVVILVGYYQTRYLYSILKDYKIEVYMVREFMEGYKLYMCIAKHMKDTVLLIENDLPEIYKIGL